MTMEELQNEIVSEEKAYTDKCRFENDVLRLGIGLMAKDHETEKNDIIKTKEKTIE